MYLFTLILFFESNWQCLHFYNLRSKITPPFRKMPPVHLIELIQYIEIYSSKAKKQEKKYVDRKTTQKNRVNNKRLFIMLFLCFLCFKAFSFYKISSHYNKYHAYPISMTNMNSACAIPILLQSSFLLYTCKKVNISASS